LSIFEAVMLICFGFAWPFNIYKSYKSRTAKGKSIIFLIVVLAGYISGIAHKILYSRDIALIFYLLNFIMVSIDILLFLRNIRLDRKSN